MFELEATGSARNRLDVSITRGLSVAPPRCRRWKRPSLARAHACYTRFGMLTQAARIAGLQQA